MAEDTKVTKKQESAEEMHFQVISPGRMVAKRFFKSYLSIIGLAMIAFVFIFSFLGPVIVDMTWKYKEIQVFKIDRPNDLILKADFIGADGKTYTYYDRSQTIVQFKAPLSKQHWLGTDTSGFDIFVRLMYGGRISLTISFIVIFWKPL